MVGQYCGNVNGKYNLCAFCSYNKLTFFHAIYTTFRGLSFELFGKINVINDQFTFKAIRSSVILHFKSI